MGVSPNAMYRTWRILLNFTIKASQLVIIVLYISKKIYYIALPLLKYRSIAKQRATIYDNNNRHFTEFYTIHSHRSEYSLLLKCIIDQQQNSRYVTNIPSIRIYSSLKIVCNSMKYIFIILSHYHTMCYYHQHIFLYLSFRRTKQTFLFIYTIISCTVIYQ